MMTTVGITGHISLKPSTRAAVAAEITRELADLDRPLVGYTSLAPGADQIFTWAVTAIGGDVVFVQPCDSIASIIPDEARTAFEAARSLVSGTIALPHTAPSEQAYYDAGAYICDNVDVLIAVWDGKPANGFGGTADIVARRKQAGTPLIVIWPKGSERG